MSEKRSKRKTRVPGGDRGGGGGGGMESAGAGLASSSPMDVDLLARIVALMTSHDLNTVDVRDGDRRVILKRGTASAETAGQQFHVPAVANPRTAAGTAGLSSEAAGGNAQADDEAKHLRITSPMVGTFYAAPKPGEKPFVTVGSVVVEDTDVCIIEAMKTFNNIKAECHGRIARILVQDGQPVEFGTVLFLVTPS